MFPLKDHLETSILFITFRRPDTTAKVFEAIKQAKPERLYVAQNFPGSDTPEDIKKWTDVRSILENVDWDCEVKRLYRTKYLTAKASISTAIDWFFQNEKEGIILEDDCLPDSTFFQFCEELLERYRDDERIAMISGDNFQFGKIEMEESYYFSRYTHIWGWASWRRSWNNYDVHMKHWPLIRDKKCLQDMFHNEKAVRYWTSIFDKTYMGNIDTWDYQWLFTCWIQNQLTILPSVNLVKNIGFGKEAVHTKVQNQFADLQTETMLFPLKHPDFLMRNYVADNLTENTNFSGEKLLLKAFHKIGQML